MPDPADIDRVAGIRDGPRRRDRPHEQPSTTSGIEDTQTANDNGQDAEERLDALDGSSNLLDAREGAQSFDRWFDSRFNGRLENDSLPILPTPPLELSRRSGADVGSSDTLGMLPTWTVPSIQLQPVSGLGDRVRSPSPMSPVVSAVDAMTSVRSHLRANLAQETRASRDLDIECVSDNEPEPGLAGNPSDGRNTRVSRTQTRSRLGPDMTYEEAMARQRTQLTELRQRMDQAQSSMSTVLAAQRTNLERLQNINDSNVTGRPPRRATNRDVPSLQRERSEISRARDEMRESASQLERLSRSLANDDDERPADSYTLAALSELDLEDLEQMRGILERLSRRQDIPDEWWMSAGLSRDVVRPNPRSRADAPRRGLATTAARRSLPPAGLGLAYEGTDSEGSESE